MTAGCCAVVGMDARLMKGGVRMKDKFEQIADVNRLKKNVNKLSVNIKKKWNFDGVHFSVAHLVVGSVH